MSGVPGHVSSAFAGVVFAMKSSFLLRRLCPGDLKLVNQKYFKKTTQGLKDSGNDSPFYYEDLAEGQPILFLFTLLFSVWNCPTLISSFSAGDISEVDADNFRYGLRCHRDPN